MLSQKWVSADVKHSEDYCGVVGITMHQN